MRLACERNVPRLSSQTSWPCGRQDSATYEDGWRIGAGMHSPSKTTVLEYMKQLKAWNREYLPANTRHAPGHCCRKCDHPLESVVLQASVHDSASGDRCIGWDRPSKLMVPY